MLRLNSFPRLGAEQSSRRAVLAFLAAGAVALSACGGSQDRVKTVTPTETVAPQQPEQEAPVDSSSLKDPEAYATADMLINTFEYSQTTPVYGECEDIVDGRGLTAGRVGFTSGTGDMLLVVERLTELDPENPLAKYLPALRKIDKGRVDYGMNPSTEGLDGLPNAWRSLAQDPAMQQAQDEITNQQYFVPSMETANRIGIRTALGQAIIYDTGIQHGVYDDEDGLQTIVKETGPYTTEAEYLLRFLDFRLNHLMNPHNEDTKQPWRDSVDRLRVWRDLIAAKEFDLKGSISWTVYEGNPTYTNEPAGKG